MSKRDDYLERLSSIDRMLWISDETSGYGVSGTAYYLTDEGFYGGVPHDESDPKVLTKKEYEEALKAIDGEEFDENECDNEIIEMVEAGCEPDIEYYTDFGGYLERYEYEAYIKEGVTNSVFTPWAELSTKELKKWCEILDEI